MRAIYSLLYFRDQPYVYWDRTRSTSPSQIEPSIGDIIDLYHNELGKQLESGPADNKEYVLIY